MLQKIIVKNYHCAIAAKRFLKIFFWRTETIAQLRYWDYRAWLLLFKACVLKRGGHLTPLQRIGARASPRARLS